MLSGKAAPPSTDAQKSRKRKTAEGHAATPSKRTETAETPSKSQAYPKYVTTPSTARKLFSPAQPTSIGPTPQRDGRVLGLFDLLPHKGTETPSRPRGDVQHPTSATVQATPSKKTTFHETPESAIKLGRTPVSSSKRHMLDSFMTPLKNRDGNTVGGGGGGRGGWTPTSVSKLQFATPAFLRRAAPMPTVDENSGYLSPPPLRLPRKPLVRGLSSVVASLRKLEEEQLDEDLEALHEMEAEGGGGQPAPPPKRPAAKPLVDEILAADSQVQNLLLGGFDDEAKLDSEPEEALGRDGNPLRVYKKKGQKRTTRRVNMKPVWTKRPAQTTQEEEGKLPGDAEDKVPETQQGDTQRVGEEQGGEAASGSEFDASDDEEAPKTTRKKRKAAEAKEGPVKKAARKVNELAHANFRRLKLRSSGAKGGPGYNSRFRRRR